MKVAHWSFLVGVLTVATEWTNALPFFEQDNKKAEDSKEPMINDVAAHAIQICGFSVKEAIEAVCRIRRNVISQKLANFFHQTSPLESSEVFASTPDNIRVPFEEVVLQGSDETSPEIVEEIFPAHYQPDGRPHRNDQQRKSLAGMQKVERDHGPEIAVIIPDRHL